jgi:hypothetical protein
MKTFVVILMITIGILLSNCSDTTGPSPVDNPNGVVSQSNGLYKMTSNTARFSDGYIYYDLQISNLSDKDTIFPAPDEEKTSPTTRVFNDSSSEVLIWGYSIGFFENIFGVEYILPNQTVTAKNLKLDFDYWFKQMPMVSGHLEITFTTRVEPGSRLHSLKLVVPWKKVG